MEGHHIFTTLFHFYHVAEQKSAARLGISAASQPLHLMQNVKRKEEHMTNAQPDKTGLHILLKLAALVVILAGIHSAADIIVQLLLALFFAIVLNPLVTWFIRRGLGRPIAITLVVVVMLFVLTALVGVLASSITEFMDMLPKYNKELTRKVLYVQEMVPFLNLHMSPERLLQRIDSDKLMTFTTTLMTGLSGAMASVFLLVMTVVFMLFEVRHVPYKMRFALNNPQIHIAGLHRALKGVSHYLALKTLLSLWTGAIVWLGLALMGIQFALMWGVLAFLLNYVPNIGSVISAVPPMLQALLFNGVYECVLVGALFLVVHMVIGNILEPRMMGHRLGLSTLVVFLSLLVWGWLLGPVGMLLSVPLTSVCKIWMETTKGGSKLAILLGPGRPKSRLPG
jgi:predicted PurR-regulated permease PerM